jgi:endonuclease/exonuclease/phosphatase family metal-dependent hydrolase
MIRLLSWNAHLRRAPLEGLQSLIEQERPNVLALQEVSESTLIDLDATGKYHTHVARDRRWGERPAYLVAGAAVPIEGNCIEVNGSCEITRSIAGRLCRWAECIESQHVRIADYDLELINVHLTTGVGPQARARELDRLLQRIAPARRTIVCGDFNTFGYGIGRVVGPLCAFRPRDYLIDERSLIGATLRDHGLNPLPLDKPTFPKAKLYLDQVAVTGDLAGAGVRVLESTFGSDHRPVMVELVG